VRTIREVLRLKHEGFSNRAIARVCQVSNSTVGEYLEKAKQAGLSWPLPEGMSEETLYQSLFLEKDTSSQPLALRAPNWEEVHRELSKRGVSLRLLWQEYREKNPDGYGKTQFGEHYQRWNQAHTNTMRLPHKGGEEMEVDYAGMTLPIINPETGEISQAQVFVAVLPASSYIYAEIQPSQTAPYIPIAHCTLAPYASAGVALRSNADESRELYGAFGKILKQTTPGLILHLRRTPVQVSRCEAMLIKGGGLCP
jgi:transposase